MGINFQSLAQLIQRIKTAMVKKLGAIDAMQFFNQFKAGNGDYAKDNVDLFGNDRVSRFVLDITAQRQG